MTKPEKYKGVANPVAHRADMERRRSSAGSPQESREERKRLRRVSRGRAIREFE